MTRPALLLWCQHSVGMGHLVRSLALAEALLERFQVTLLSGGAVPAGLDVPTGLRIVALPPLAHDDGAGLASRDARWTADEARRIRGERILAEHRATAPAVVMIELYPFGRRRFAYELLPLLEQAAGSALVVCSLRDILVTSRRDQQRHDEQASTVANRWFDAVLVHADARFARLEESFRPRTPLAVPVHYTGFVHRPRAVAPRPAREPRVLVSAGGGLVGGPLLAVAAAAAPAVRTRLGLRTRIITGPFLPRSQRAHLAAVARKHTDCLDVVGFVPDLAAEMAAAAVSVSQCGYNTAMDVVASGVPAVVVPYAGGREDEQLRRARRLQSAGALSVLPAGELDVGRLVVAVRDAMARGSGNGAAVALDGAARTVEILASAVEAGIGLAR